jgi:hypothetical protein
MTDTTEGHYDFSNVRGRVGNLYRTPQTGRPPLAYDPTPYGQPNQTPQPSPMEELPVITDEMWQQYNTFMTDQQKYAEQRSHLLTHEKERARALAITAEYCFDQCLNYDTFYYRIGKDVIDSERSCLEACAAKTVEYHKYSKKLFDKYLYLINRQ